MKLLAQAHGIRGLALKRADMSEFWTELAVAYGGRVHTLGLELERDANNNPHCGGYAGGRADELHIEPGQPPVLTLRLHAYEVHHPWPASGGDDGRDGLPGGLHLEIQKATCLLHAAGPSCTTHAVSKRDLPYDPAFSPEQPPPVEP